MFEIIFDEDSLACRSSTTKNVTGVLYVRIGGKDFPEAGWRDFPCIVLGWWSVALRGDIGAGTELVFMDGPAVIKVLPDDDNDLLLTPIWADQPECEPVRVPADAVRGAVQRAIAALVDACHRRALPIHDVIEPS